MIGYAPLWRTMKRKKVSSYALIHKHGIPNSTLWRMRKGKPISTTTIDDLCRILKCRPGSIIEYVKEEPPCE